MNNHFTSCGSRMLLFSRTLRRDSTSSFFASGSIPFMIISCMQSQALSRRTSTDMYRRKVLQRHKSLSICKQDTKSKVVLIVKSSFYSFQQWEMMLFHIISCQLTSTTDRLLAKTDFMRIESKQWHIAKETFLPSVSIKHRLMTIVFTKQMTMWQQK